jgi:hypothetical protein
MTDSQAEDRAYLRAVCALAEPETLDEMIARVRLSLPDTESVFVPDGDAWTDTGRGDV